MRKGSRDPSRQVGPQQSTPRTPLGPKVSGWRERVELAFERWGYFVCRQRWWVVLFAAAATLLCASFIPRVTIDNSTEAFLLPSDPAVVTYNDFRDEFTRDDRLLVAVTGSEIFELDFLERLRALHRDLEERIPFVEEVESLVNARVTRGDGDALIVGELLEEWPENAADVARAQEIALSNPLYRGTLLSEDGLFTTLSIKPQTYTSQGAAFDPLAEFDPSDSAADQLPYLSASEGTALVEALQDVLARHEGDGFEIHLAGALAVTQRMNIAMTNDLLLIVPLTVVVMAALLALLFRRTGGVLLPLVIVVLPLVNTLGIMVMLGIPGSTAIQILPIFLLTVGICDAVHILSIAYRLRAEGAEQQDAIARAIGHSGLAVVMTSLTTAAGMASFLFAKMLAVVHLGILAPIGILLALVYTVTLLPALLCIFPMAVRGQAGPARPGLMERLLVAAGTFAIRAPWRVLLPTALLVLVFTLGVLQTRLSHNTLLWFPEEDETRVDVGTVDHALGGSVSVDVLIDTGEPGGLYEPEMLARIERIMKQAPKTASEPLFVGKAMSIVDVVKEIHQALSGGDPAQRRIPDTRAAVAQELLLFEQSGSDVTAEWVDSEYQRARINLRVPFEDAIYFGDFLDALDTLVTRELDGRAEHHVTGLLTLLTRLMVALIDSMLRSYGIALLVITPLMMLLLGSLRRGCVSMVPNLLPILASVGVMGWVGVPLDTTTMLLGAMVIGLAVDDTIHFMHKFQRYFDELCDFEAAVRETLRTTGSALLVTTLVISGGFAMFVAAEMSNSRAFGLVAAFACLVAFVADLLVAPAMLALLHRYTGSLHRRRAALFAARTQGSSTTFSDSESLAANAKASAAESSG